jgi:hypothetical protein
VAVAVEAVPFVVLDEAFKIVEVSPAAEAGFGPLRGRNVFESFPGSRPLFLPYYEEALESGDVVEFAQYYDGYVMDMKVVPAGRMLTVYWERLCMLDVLTLQGLSASLFAVLETLEARENALRREVVRRSLRLVRGDP